MQWFGSCGRALKVWASQSVVRWVTAVKACHVVEGEVRRERNVELRTGSIGLDGIVRDRL